MSDLRDELAEAILAHLSDGTFSSRDQTHGCMCGQDLPTKLDADHYPIIVRDDDEHFWTSVDVARAEHHADAIIPIIERETERARAEVGSLIREVLTLREQRARGPRVACICGSTKQRAEHEELAHALTMAGRIVLMCGVWGGPLTEAEKGALDVLHLRKIDAADEVWFVEKPDGSLGESTSREHAYATAAGKPCLMVPAGESANIRRALGVTEEAETDA